jgi:hypothetical protein
MTTTENPAVPPSIPARELRKGDVISMGTIDTATIPEGKDYVSIRFESKIGEHGTAFPPDLEVTVFSRATVEDPALDFTSPMLMCARGLKPGMAVIQQSTNTALVVQAVTAGTPGYTVISYQGAPDVTVPDLEGFEVTRLSAMAVYHASQAQRHVVTALIELAEAWDGREAFGEGSGARTYGICSTELRVVLARLQ